MRLTPRRYSRFSTPKKPSGKVSDFSQPRRKRKASFHLKREYIDEIDMITK